MRLGSPPVAVAAVRVGDDPGHAGGELVGELDVGGVEASSDPASRA